MFAKDSGDLGHTDVVKHHIDTGDEQPVRQRPRRLPQTQVDELRRQIEELRKRNIIRESESNWGSNVVLVKKKDSTLRRLQGTQRDDEERRALSVTPH